MKCLNFISLLLIFLVVSLTNVMAKPDPVYKLPRIEVPETHNIEQKFIEVLGNKMAYLEMGKGEPVIYIHGNPTSSYLWRNVIPHVSKNKRNIAVDLIGMGASDKPDIEYSFSDHYDYFSKFIDAHGFKKITLVGHDWGAAIAWEYARLNPEKVRGIAFMEGVLPPGFPFESFEAMGKEMGDMFRSFKDPVQGNQMVIENNMFIEQVLPNMVNRRLGETAMNAYRKPFIEKADRKPVLVWPREVPIAGQPQSTVNVLDHIRDYMGETTIPALLLYAEPGVIIPPKAVAWYVDKIKNLRTTYIGQGLHFIQEDQPDAIGRALNDWVARLQ